jgi:hypothetical protein
LDITSKKGGKVANTAHVVVSADGKTRAVNLSSTDSSGKKLSGVSIYNKQ